MATLRFTLLILCFVIICVPSQGAIEKKIPAVYTAECRLGKFESAGGYITFTQKKKGGPTYISGVITNVTPGLHGWHVHELPISSKKDPCGSAGGHFNPLNVTHGAPKDRVRHFGDLGNFKANSYGVGVVATTDRLVSLRGRKKKSVLGRTIVIHADRDDLGRGGDAGSRSTGNAGARVGCCVIRRTKLKKQ